ncbi:MAG: nuclear transport factor 2 family protein [Solirubrobacterales bacterium]
MSDGGMKSDRFRAAAEAKDFEAGQALFSEGVTFWSPFVHSPYEGRDAVLFLLANVAQVFEEFRYVAQVETGDTAVLMFEARVGDRELQGVDVLVFGEGDLIEEMTVMVRPMSGLEALGTEMGRRLEAQGVEPA